MEDRINALRRRFRSLGIANFLVTRLSNVRYLCGFTGTSGVLLITGQSAYFITDGRYTTQAQAQVKGATVITYASGLNTGDPFIYEMKSNKNIRFRGRMGIEAQQITLDRYQQLCRAFPNSTLIETTDVVEKIAAVKNRSEVASIARAVAISDQVFESILPDLKPNVSEKELAAEISYRQKKLGADKDAFECIIAAGLNSAKPHGVASDNVIREGDFVTLDFGCCVDGYPSDLTRTVVVGKPSERKREVYSVVHKAQRQAIEAIKAGVRCADVDAVARKIIKKAGYGDHFTHGLGHGLGLEVHAFPRLASGSKERLKEGMVITVEPGIYIEGFGGVRIEDDVVVTEEGCTVLNRSPRELLELG